ncbi:uncharacterized protein VICG_01939, partial [Vittaforma corneae ATCC 50505]
VTAVEFKEISTHEEKTEFKNMNRAIFPVVYDDEFYDTMLFRSSYHAALVYCNNQIVGTLSFEVKNRAVYVFTFGLLQRFRGIGLGEKIWTKVEDIFKTTFQCCRILLHTQTSNLKAVDFYKKHGFIIKETVSEYYEGLPCNAAYLFEKYV